ncbi:DUF4303 domain-containing protein [Streptomyces sp. NPDC097107]|uniref:DUF4303 domain-containing protein n=1 Tax=Streptomyces sp. NPDC097107 TaxID=3366089 RepID=UPI003821E479
MLTGPFPSPRAPGADAVHRPRPASPDAVHRAARAALPDLFRDHPDHRFYSCPLVTSPPARPTGRCCPRGPSRPWPRSRHARPCAPLDSKWSYADSPLCGYGERHMEPVRPLFEARGERGNSSTCPTESGRPSST